MPVNCQKVELLEILRDRLDFDDELLAELDVVVASLHVPSSDEAENTKRLIRAAENKYVHILGHLTGRLLLEREPYPVNAQAVIDACAGTGTWIELNCDPHRFDLDWRLWPYAKSQGVKCVINPDAHRNEHAGFFRLVPDNRAQGWLWTNRRCQHIGLGVVAEGIKPQAVAGLRSAMLGHLFQLKFTKNDVDCNSIFLVD